MGAGTIRWLLAPWASEHMADLQRTHRAGSRVCEKRRPKRRQRQGSERGKKRADVRKFMREQEQH